MSILRAHKVLGVVFCAVLLLAGYLTYAVFTKKFADYDEVTLKASKIGLNLPERADVKVRGLIVGEVLDVEATGDGATIRLGLYPDLRAEVPADVTGSIVPKTLFGEKYVALVVPENSSARPIRTGATIARTEVATEVEQVLNDLYPLLRAVQPAQINTTLNALATAIEGRGEQLGENLETVDAYLKQINPEIPLLVEDLRLSVRVSDTYSDVLPQVADILRDTIKTTGTLRDREQKLNALFTDVGAFSDTTRTFLAENRDNIIRVGELGSQQLAVLEKYAPQYPCLLGGIVNAGRLNAEAFRNFTLHIVLETLPNQPRGYTAADTPRYGAKNGPYCGALPNPPWNQQNLFDDLPDFDDGIDEPTNKGTIRVAPTWSDSGERFAGGAAETALLKGLIGPATGRTADDVPDLGPLLLGPMARGAEVSLR